MLNIVEMSDVGKYIETINDERIRKLLHKMHFEYEEYMRIGSVEQLRGMKDLMDVPMSQIANAMVNSVDCYRDEMNALRKENEQMKEILHAKKYRNKK